MVLPFFSKGKATAGLTGIDLQPDGVSVVRVSRTAGRPPRVGLCEFHPWNAGSSREKVLAQLAAECGLKRGRCITTLAHDDYKLLLTEAPDVQADELKAAVRWRVKDLIDFHINDATLDVFDLPAAGPGKSRSMYAVVARNEAIKRRVDLMQGANIALDVVDIPELAQRNLAALLPEDANGIVMLSLEATHGLVTVTKQGDLYLSRSLDLGLDTIERSDDRIATYDRLVLEVQRSLDYFDSHFRQAPITRIVLPPPASTLPGLLEHLNANLNAKASALDLTAVLEFERPIDPAVQIKCLTTLGAALRQESVAL